MEEHVYNITIYNDTSHTSFILDRPLGLQENRFIGNNTRVYSL